MFHDALNRVERIWLLALRLSHAWRGRPALAAGTVDRLFAGAAMGQLGGDFGDLFEALRSRNREIRSADGAASCRKATIARCRRALRGPTERCRRQRSGIDAIRRGR